MKILNLTLLLLMGLVIVSGCYYYVPSTVVTSPDPPYASPYVSPYASYDNVWENVMRAAQDVGIQITSSNRNTGTIFGHRDRVGVTIQVIQQADGRTRIELTVNDSQGSSSAIADDFYRTYDYYYYKGSQPPPPPPTPRKSAPPQPQSPQSVPPKPAPLPPKPTPPSKVIDKMTLQVFFDFNKDTLTEADLRELQKVVAFVKKYPGAKIRLDGYTDSIGEDAYNIKLSERRATAVMNYLIKEAGIDRSKITAVGHGKADPVADNETAEGRAKNRRVEISILSD